MTGFSECLGGILHIPAVPVVVHVCPFMQNDWLLRHSRSVDDVHEDVQLFVVSQYELMVHCGESTYKV